MARIIAWDIERFDEVIARIDRCIQTLEEQKSTIMNLREATADNWVSDAGREYAERIDEDLKNLEDILEKFRDTRKDIEEAERKYAGGELDMHSKLLSLYQSLSVY